MVEVPQNRDVLSQVAPDFLPNFQSGGDERNIETTPAPRAARYFLEGPKSRSSELFTTLHIVRDFLKGFRVLHFVGPCVTVFGSARFTSEHPFYECAREVGRGLSRLGFTVMTGGGPGLMEAANRGARESGGKSVGCNIRLPEEHQPNPYLDRQVTLRHFFVRKVLLIKYSYAFIAMPGGFGTMDEFFEALTLIQTRMIQRFPIVLMGKAYWNSLLELLQRMNAASTIDPADLKLLLVTDSVEEAMRHLQRHAVEQFGLRRQKVKVRRSWLLRE
ncbi:MAG TPA: TIGR00730 family Rossman fold protein [Pyrinomonadaceae bacterium]|nr:TIGR00730 family Rossman fold protein [Pyrinomonadaceae bacterium]